MTRRIFVSGTIKRYLTKRQRQIREAIIRRIEAEGFVTQIFDVGGIRNEVWSAQACTRVMQRCQGAVLIGFPRWFASDQGKPIKLATEFLHYEGVLARTMRLPILTIVEEGVAERGVIEHPLKIPEGADENWTRSHDFSIHLRAWLRKLKSRDDVFLGYCSKGSPIAKLVAKHLKRKGLRVRDWQRHFRYGRIIIDELEKAARECSGAIFVFSEDDRLAGTQRIAAPRDNVIFEAGYFINARGRERVLVIREGAAKMPADLGGTIYAGVPSRKKLPAAKMAAAVEKQVDIFIKKAL